MKKFEFQKSALCRGGVSGSPRWFGCRVARSECVLQCRNCWRAESERQIQRRLCVAAAVQTSSASSALLLLLSLLLLGSNSRGKGDQCRNPRKRISQA